MEISSGTQNEAWKRWVWTDQWLFYWFIVVLIWYTLIHLDPLWLYQTVLLLRSSGFGHQEDPSLSNNNTIQYNTIQYNTVQTRNQHLCPAHEGSGGVNNGVGTQVAVGGTSLVWSRGEMATATLHVVRLFGLEFVGEMVHNMGEWNSVVVHTSDGCISSSLSSSLTHGSCDNISGEK